MTIDEDLTFSVDSRFNSISLHAPEPLHFYGAEVMDSSLPSPSRHIPGYLDSTSEESDSDSVGEIDDSEASSVQLDEITGDQAGRDCSNPEGCKASTNQVRDGPLEKLWGGGEFLEPQELFFLIKCLV